jgi:hypothetical protein
VGQILEVDDEWNILKCTLHWRGVQKISITLAKLVEFLVTSIFHETKIRTVDMKVQVYSKFRKNKIPKKVKSPNSIWNGRFDTSKCRGKLEKMGVLCTHSPKCPGPFPKLPIKNWSKCRRKHQKKKKKKRTKPTLSKCRPAAGGQPLVAGRPWAVRRPEVINPWLWVQGRARVDTWIGSACPFFLIFFVVVLLSTFCASSQLLLIGSRTCPPCLEFT